MTKGPPPPVEVRPGRIGVVVVGPPKEPSLPLTGAEAAATWGLTYALVPPFFYWASPLVAYHAGKCADAIYKVYPNLPSQFKEAVGREFSQELLRSSFVEAMTARTKSPVIPLEVPSGAGYFSHATALTTAAHQEMELLVELVAPVVALGGASWKDDDCEHVNLALRIEVQATRVKDQQVIYKDSLSAGCGSRVSFDTVGKWLNEPGALAGELAPCAGDLAHKLLDYDSNPYTHRPQLKLPE
jgi:hypothetical protein